MNFQAFLDSLQQKHPPAELTPILKSLWYDGKEDWDAAHDIAQDIHDWQGSWVHAYLHRKEGDIWNADYWYRSAGKKRPLVSLREEWELIVKELLVL